MGCAPSLQVSSPGAATCQDDHSPAHAANHQPPQPPNQPQGPSGQNQHGVVVSSCPNTADHPCLPQTDGNYLKLGPMKIVQSQLKVLLVFGKEDNISEAWWSACKHQKYDATLRRSTNDVLSAVYETAFDLIVIDARSTKYLNPESICNSIRASNNCQFSVMVAIIKKNFADRDTAMVGQLLKYGCNRVVAETAVVGGIVNELIQIEHSDHSNRCQLRAMQAIFSAVDACKEIIHVTDTQHRIQYINRACEHFLGYSLDDVVGHNLWELHTLDSHKADMKAIDHRPSVDFKVPLEHHQRIMSDHRQLMDHRHSSEFKTGDMKLDISEAVNMQMRRGREWEGMVTCRRKSGDILHLPSKVIPVAPLLQKNEYYVYVSDTHVLDRLEFSTSTVDHFHPRGSIKSLRKGSHDIRSLNSDGTQNVIRRQSLVKLNSVTIEAPITRVFNIISAAQENSPAYVAQALEKALEILRSTELYSPQLITAISDNVKPRPADPVATDLLGGLLAQAPKPLSSGRRSSNDTVVKVSQLPRPSLPILHQQASAAIRELLAEDMSWNFEIIKLEKISDKRPLVWLGMSLLCKFDVPDTLGCDEQTLQNWLTLIEANYHADNSYHNSTHAADVLQATAYFLNQERIKQLMDPLDVAACLIAAVVHDVDHPGKNSAFLCNTDNELAILYNDLCVLESHHSAVSFKFSHSDDRVNIFKALERDVYKHIRKSIIDMILATDMTKHFEHLSKFVNMSGNSKIPLKEDDTASLDGTRDSPDFLSFSTPENLVIIKRMMIKCADVSNPLRPIHLSIDWAYRIANEYFNQTEEEKKRSLPIVMPQFDRTTCSIPKSQIGFIDFFINDMFDAWDALADIPELMNHLRRNYQYWKEKEETGEEAAITCLSQPLSRAEEEDEDEDKEGEGCDTAEQQSSTTATVDEGNVNEKS